MHNEVLLKISSSPELPGVYRMMDIDGTILYIGKAKNLHNRLTSYTRDNLHLRTQKMLNDTYSAEYVITKTEKEALLLESRMIKSVQPKYNVLLKDDRSFPYLKITVSHLYPQVSKYRGKSFDKKEKYFGPFASSQYLDAAIKELTKIFKIRTCGDIYFSTRKRPCVQHQIQRCSAPCVGKISALDYQDKIQQAIDLLSGHSQNIIKNLKGRMKFHSDQMAYERASEIRDTIFAIEHLKQRHDLAFSAIKDADVIAIISDGTYAIIQMFIFRGGNFLGNKNYFFDQGTPMEEILETFISRFYENNTPPSEIILSHEIEVSDSLEFIESLYNVKIATTVPRRGNKFKIVEYVKYNASVALSEYIKSKAKTEFKLQKIQSILGMQDFPHRIEVYDNSHIMGSFPVGVMIVLINGVFQASEYRKYNIKSNIGKFGGDDYQMLREVLTRRMNKAKDTGIIPNLMIIDGGKGHLNTAAGVVKSYDIGASITLIGMAKGSNRNKGEEQFFLPDKDPFTLDNTTEVMQFLQVMRDEAHNFAIRSHRKMRDKI